MGVDVVMEAIQWVGQSMGYDLKGKQVEVMATFLKGRDVLFPWQQAMESWQFIPYYHW